MAFDLSGAVQQARTGTIPANWRRYPLRFVRNTIGISLIVGILCIVGAIFIWVTGSIPLISVVLVALRVDPSIISLISGLIVLAVGIFGLVTGLVFAIRFHRLWDRDRYFFLVTPEGFAEVKGEKVVGLAFAEVADLKERNGSLVVRKRTGEYMTLEIRWSYWPRKITKTLLKKLAAQRQAQG